MQLLFVQGCPWDCCLCKVVFEIVVYARLSMWLFVQGCPCDCARLSVQLFVHGCLLDCCLHKVVHVIVQCPCDCLCKVVYAVVCARCPCNCLRLSLQLFARCCPCSRLHKVVHGLLVQGCSRDCCLCMLQWQHWGGACWTRLWCPWLRWRWQGMALLTRLSSSSITGVLLTCRGEWVTIVKSCFWYW